MTSLDIFSPTTKCVIGDHIDGTINQVIIRAADNGYSVQYQVVWWDGNTRKSEWLDRHEVQVPTDQQLLRIGFQSAL